MRSQSRIACLNSELASAVGTRVISRAMMECYTSSVVKRIKQVQAHPLVIMVLLGWTPAPEHTAISFGKVRTSLPVIRLPINGFIIPATKLNMALATTRMMVMATSLKSSVQI